MFRRDHAFLRLDPPFAAGRLCDVGDPVVADDGGAQLLGALRQRIATPGRIDVAVHVCIGTGENTVDVHIRQTALDFVGADDFHMEADVRRKAGDMSEPVDLNFGEGEADAAGLVPAHGLAGLFFQRRVEDVGVVMDFRQIVTADEARALAGGVPGGA